MNRSATVAVHAYPLSFQAQAYAGTTHADCHRQPPHPSPLPRWGEGERGRAAPSLWSLTKWVRVRLSPVLTVGLTAI